MGLADGYAWERDYPQTYYTCDCVVSEIREVRIACNSREEYEEKIKALGYRIVPMSVPHKTDDGARIRY